jgi:hypothetical protein
LIKPRPKHYKAEEDKWADFKKVRELIDGYFNILFIDESRRSINTELRRVLAPKGIKANSKS